MAEKSSGTGGQACLKVFGGNQKINDRSRSFPKHMSSMSGKMVAVGRARSSAFILRGWIWWTPVTQLLDRYSGNAIGCFSRILGFGSEGLIYTRRILALHGESEELARGLQSEAVEGARRLQSLGAVGWG